MSGLGEGRQEPGPRHDRARWIVLVLVALAVRVTYLFLATDVEAVPSDSGHYREIASNLAAGDGFSSTFPQLFVHATAFRPPGYPVLLAGLFRITGPSMVGGKLLNVAIGVAVVVLVAWLVRHRVSPTAGWIAGGLVAMYPPLVANDVNLLTEPLSLLLLVLLAAEVSGRARWWLLGMETALLVLTRPSAQAFSLVVIAYTFRRIGFRRTAAYAVVVVMLVAPWMVRNRLQVGTWNLYTSNGFNIAAMYSKPAQDSRSFVDPVFDERFRDHRLSQFDEGAWDREMAEVGFDGLRSNPRYVVFNVGRNAVATLELWPALNEPAEREDGRNLTVRLVTLPVFYVVTGLGVVGSWRRRRTVAVSFLAVSGLYFVVVSLFFVAPPRLRAPFDLACCVGTAVLVATWLQASAASRTLRWPGPGQRDRTGRSPGSPTSPAEFRLRASSVLGRPSAWWSRRAWDEPSPTRHRIVEASSEP